MKLQELLDKHGIIIGGDPGMIEFKSKIGAMVTIPGSATNREKAVAIKKVILTLKNIVQKMEKDFAEIKTGD